MVSSRRRLHSTRRGEPVSRRRPVRARPWTAVLPCRRARPGRARAPRTRSSAGWPRTCHRSYGNGTRTSAWQQSTGAS